MGKNKKKSSQSKNKQSQSNKPTPSPNSVSTDAQYLSKYPLVSICTPTFNRRPFIQNMFQCFRNQDYPADRIEWIIVDDGTDKIKDLIVASNIPQIRYFEVEKKMFLGAKRNYMPVCESWLELNKAPLRFFVFKKISEASSPRTRREGRPSPPRALTHPSRRYDAGGDVRADRAMRAHALACSRAQCATPASGASSFPHHRHAPNRKTRPRSDNADARDEQGW